MAKINLTKKDYELIDSFCKEHNISLGKFNHNLLIYFLNEYKRIRITHKQKDNRGKGRKMIDKIRYKSK